MAAEAFGVAASALAVVELSAKVVKMCAQYTKEVANARQDIERLQKEVESLVSIAESVRVLSENTPQHKVATIKKVQLSLDEGRTRLAELQTKLDPSKRERYMSRIGLRAMKWPFSSKDVEKALGDLTRLTHAISLAMQVDQTTVILNLEQKTVLAKLPIVEGAAYDSYADEHNPRCLENTRTAVLRDIVEWMRDPSSKAVYWLNGMAGTGKSTIARTIANRFSSEADIGAHPVATFFFKRGEGDRGNMSKLFTTITSQLVQQLPVIAGYVQAALEADPALISKALQIQFEKLILYPIANISLVDPSHRILLFVIDALDECEREQDVQLLIKLLSDFARATTVQLRFFLTSRPELPIRLGFNSIDGEYRDFILHQVAESIIEHDLQVYLKHELERTRLVFNQGLPEERKLPPNWPSSEDLGSLVQMAMPLFIFASTTCRFVADRKGGNPEKKLRRVLEFRSAQGSKLVATYMPVLEQLTMDLTQEEHTEFVLQFRQIVGSIVVLADPLGPKPLSRLLDIEIEEILELLDFLHSVLQVPSSTEKPIRLLHLSFRDFLVDPARQGNPFWVDEKKAHQKLAERCLRVLNSSLKDDICNVKAPGTLISSISTSRIRTRIQPELEYACRFWAYHLQESSSLDIQMAEIRIFLQSHFLHWLEALSWIGRLPESFGIVTTLQSISYIERDHEMTEFLKDSVRFLQAANSSIQIAPLQVYSSSLAFAPSQSIVRLIYEGDMADYIALGPRMPSAWDARLQTFEVDYNRCNTEITWNAYLSDGKLLGVAFTTGTVILLAADTGVEQLRLERYGASVFSPNGKLLALVTKNRNVTLWQIETGEPQHMLNGHRDIVVRILFSPDSKFLASLSRDGVLILWAVDTGNPLQALDIFSDISSERFNVDKDWPLAISPNNELVALKSVKNAIILWETETGKYRQTLKGHSSTINSIDFSSDSKLLASASRDKKIILWDTEKAEQRRVLVVHTRAVNTVAFSLDNDLLAFSASDDQTVTLWQTKTGLCRSLEGHDTWVRYIEFSPNGKLLASASCDGTVLLWAAETGEWLSTFEGGAGSSTYISFSADSKRLVTTSTPKSIRVWATDLNDRGQMLEKHSEPVNVMKFSPDGRLLASASADGSVILWRADTGEQRHALKGHSRWIHAIDFSPDSKLLASASVDQTVVLWIVDTGERRAILTGHTGSVKQVVFSPDGKMLASAALDRTVTIWDVDTGARRNTLEGHSDRIRSIVFSPHGRMLALALEDGTASLWATETGERLRIFRCYSPQFLEEIVFPSDSKLVALYSGETFILWKAETDDGRPKGPFPALPSQSNGKDIIGPTISWDKCWICWGGKRVLWLPLEYRTDLSAVSGHTIALGCESGRVLFVRLKSPYASP